MQYCPKCKITIRGNKHCCPLCQGKLTGEPEDAAFPTIKRNKVSGFSIIGIATFLFLAMEIVLGTGIYLERVQTGRAAPWTYITMLSIVFIWFDLVLALYLRNNILKIITTQTYFIMLMSIWIDCLTGFHRWSFNWMLPLFFLGIVAVTLLISRILKMKLEDFIIYLFIDMIFCMLQIIGIAVGFVTIQWPAVICIAIYLIMAVATAIFRFRDFRNASAKWFNF